MTPTTETDDDFDAISAARPGAALGLISFVIVAAGLAGLMVWPQLVVFGLRPRGIFENVVPPLVSLLGLLSVPLGALVALGRLWGAIASLVSVGGLLFFGLVWTLYAFIHGLLTPLYPIVVIGAALALLASVFGVGLSWRVTRARHKLMYE